MTNLLFYPINLTNVRNLWSEIQQHYSSRVESISVMTQVFYDTFDWRLYRKNLTLIRQEKDLCLAAVDTLEPSSKALWRSRSHPRFWWQLPDGPLKDDLKPLLDVRALIPLATIEKKRRTLFVLNEDEKAVVKIHHDYIHLNDVSQRRKNIHSLLLQPIKGYNKDYRNLQKFLKESGVVKGEESAYFRILKDSGRIPGDYTSKFMLDLTPDLHSDKATRMILRYLIDVMKSNERGVKADTDIEFLHDFRVSSRRVRSALGQIKGIFPSVEADHFRKDFSILGKMTNKLRDLDVYLMRKDQYRSLLPQHTVDGLNPFFEDLLQTRKTELRNVRKFLNS